VSYQPQFIVTPALLKRVEQIAALRERILAATVEVPWIPALQKTRAPQYPFLDGHRGQSAHAGTGAGGGGRPGNSAVAPRAKREVVNYFAGLRFVEQNAAKKTITHEEIFRLHKIIAGE